MFVLKDYHNNIVKHDFIHKYAVHDLSHLPKITKVILRFDLKHASVTPNLISSILALVRLSNQNPKLSAIKSQSTVNFKTKSGSIVGCSVTLRKNNMWNFLTDFIFLIHPQSKKLEDVIVESSNYASLNSLNTFSFSMIEDNYNIFRKLPDLKVSFITNTNSLRHSEFLIKSFKLNVKNKSNV